MTTGGARNWFGKVAKNFAQGFTDPMYKDGKRTVRLFGHADLMGNIIRAVQRYETPAKEIVPLLRVYLIKTWEEAEQIVPGLFPKGARAAMEINISNIVKFVEDNREALCDTGIDEEAVKRDEAEVSRLHKLLIYGKNLSREEALVIDGDISRISKRLDYGLNLRPDAEDAFRLTDELLYDFWEALALALDSPIEDATDKDIVDILKAIKNSFYNRSEGYLGIIKIVFNHYVALNRPPSKIVKDTFFRTVYAFIKEKYKGNISQETGADKFGIYPPPKRGGAVKAGSLAVAAVALAAGIAAQIWQASSA